MAPPLSARPGRALMFEVTVEPGSGGRVDAMSGGAAGARYDALVRAWATRLAGCTLWHVNATAEGGGVAELLHSTLGHLRADGIDARWLVIDADAPFFAITKRIHNRLHGDLGDAGPLGEGERRRYDDVIGREFEQMRDLVRPGDLVVVHDPQPLGLVPGLVALGATVVWTCHVGIDTPNDIARSAWAFLVDDVRGAHASTFTRRAYAWDGLDPDTIHVIPPCIDPLSPKNVGIAPNDIDAILHAAGLLGSADPSDAVLARGDGSQTRISHPADVIESARLPDDAVLVTQVSRWDALKDPVGLVQGFVETPELSPAHLVLAGPAPSSVADDPEADGVLREVRDLWNGLRLDDRRRVHIANLPVVDPVENAIVVNALQRRSDVIVQKSLAEGFGLTVTEAMWKGRPVVASRVGGIRDQIDDGISGVLVDPRDLGSFGMAVAGVLADPARALGLGEAARRRVEARYLPTRYLGDYLELFLRLSG